MLAQGIPMKRIRPIERQPMKEWLKDILDSGEVPSISWIDKSKQEFKIKWCHGSRHGWSIKDADLFERWAKHTGRYYFGGKEDPKRWKANFRCALNSLKTIEEVRDKSQAKGSNACRIYRMINTAKKEPRETRQARRTNGKQMMQKGVGHCVKYEEATKHEDMSTSDSDSINEEIEKISPTPDNSRFTQTKTERDSCLPNFDKISPGIDKIEFGRMHCLPNHSSGFTVKMGTSFAAVQPTSPTGKVKISLPESFQRQISGSGSTSQSSTNYVNTTTDYKPVVFPESPEASDASPPSALQEEEMIEINLFEVSEEVEVDTSPRDSNYILTNLDQWSQTGDPCQTTVSNLAQIMNSSQMQSLTHSTSDWTHGYSPLTPP